MCTVNVDSRHRFTCWKMSEGVELRNKGLEMFIFVVVEINHRDHVPLCEQCVDL